MCIRDRNFGEWEGRPWDEVPRAELDAWAADVMTYAPPGGESAQQVLARTLDFLLENPSPEIAVVTHAGVIRLLLSFHNKQSVNVFFERSIPYGGLISLYSFCHI